MESVYLETTLISYLVARPSRERLGQRMPIICTPEERMGA
jgi:hypothetical protein